jgi:hypothetical protein
MISYCHADKELVYRIQEFLANKGFKIWFDRDNMYGPGKNYILHPILHYTPSFSNASNG